MSRNQYPFRGNKKGPAEAGAFACRPCRGCNLARVRLAIAVVFLSSLLVAGAGAAPTATVRIGDGSLNPNRVRIDAGGSVTWRNTGTRAHRVTSSSGAFAAFTLAPARARTVTFRSKGRHPYRVDGRRCAVVFVGVPLGAGCSGSGASGGSGGSGPRRPPPGTRTYRYDVTLSGEVTNERGTMNGGIGEIQSRSLKWTGTIRNFRVTVVATGSTWFTSNARTAGSTARWTEKWRWHWVTLARTEVNCEGEGTQNVPLFLFVNARSGRTNFMLQSNGAGANDIANARVADCNGRSMQPFETPTFTWSGMRVQGDGGLPYFEFQRETGGLVTPVGELVTGRPFALDTGTFSTEDPDGFLKTTQRYIARFTPRR
jgi:plastocyanin